MLLQKFEIAFSQLTLTFLKIILIILIVYEIIQLNTPFKFVKKIIIDFTVEEKKMHALKGLTDTLLYQYTNFYSFFKSMLKIAYLFIKQMGIFY